MEGKESQPFFLTIRHRAKPLSHAEGVEAPSLRTDLRDNGLPFQAGISIDLIPTHLEQLSECREGLTLILFRDGEEVAQENRVIEVQPDTDRFVRHLPSRLASFWRSVRRGGCFSAHAIASSRSALVCGRWSQRSLSGMKSPSLMSHTP